MTVLLHLLKDIDIYSNKPQKVVSILEKIKFETKHVLSKYRLQFVRNFKGHFSFNSAQQKQSTVPQLLLMMIQDSDNKNGV